MGIVCVARAHEVQTQPCLESNEVWLYVACCFSASCVICSVFGWCFNGASAAALADDALSRIRQTQTINIGYVDSSKPFAYADAQGKPDGYTIELCSRVVDRLRKELKLPNLKTQYVRVALAERIPKLGDGSIDMECGSMTNTKARQEKVDFSYTIFVAGMKILSRSNEAIADPKALANKTVALSKGSTSEKLFSQLRNSEVKTMKLADYPSNLDALNAVAAGKASAFVQDDILIAGLLNSMPDKDSFVLSAEYLSVEPYAIALRKGEAPLLAVVDKTLAELYSSGEITKIYDKWFNNRTMRYPMSSLFREVVQRPAKDSGFAKVLGYSL